MEDERGLIEHLKGIGYDSRFEVTVYSTWIGLPYSSKAGVILNVWSIEATWMNNEFMAKYLPGQILRPYPKQAISGS